MNVLLLQGYRHRASQFFDVGLICLVFSCVLESGIVSHPDRVQVLRVQIGGWNSSHTTRG